MTRGDKNTHGLNRAIDEREWRELFDTQKCRPRESPFASSKFPLACRTSQDRSRCGARFPKAPSERIHRRSVCFVEVDRDANVDRNALSRGLRIFAWAMAARGTAPVALATSAAR